MAVGYNPKIVTDGLVLALDAGNTKSYPGSGTAWTDLSGNGNNGTLTNGPTFNSGNGGSIVFDGSNDHVVLPSTLITNRPFSINAWFYFNNLTGWQTVLGQDTSQAIQQGSYYFQKTTNGSPGGGRTSNAFGVAIINSAGTEIYCYDSTAITAGVWYNYCASVSATDLRLYRNGNLVTTTNDSNAIATVTGNTILGAGYFGNAISDYTNARISSFQIYNRALTAAEVLQNFNALRGRFSI